MYEKHRDEKETYEFDFTQRLVGGETISSPSVIVSKKVQGLYTDVSVQFLALAPLIVGNKVQFTLIAAGQSNHQTGDTNYIVKCSVTTSQGRNLVGWATLAVATAGVTGFA